VAPRCVEPLEQLLRRHGAAPFLVQILDRAGDRLREPVQPVALGDERGMVLAQHRGAVLGAVEHAGDGVEREPELPEHQHLLQAQQLLPLVVPVSVAGHVRRRHQADVVVVPQGPGAHARVACHLDDRPAGP